MSSLSNAERWKKRILLTPFIPDQPIIEGFPGLTPAVMFDRWLALPQRTLRNLQRKLAHEFGPKLPLNKISQICEDDRWRERAFALQLQLEAETNKAAYESIREGAVRRRAEALEVVGEVFDKVLLGCRKLVESKKFATQCESGDPLQLQRLIKSLHSLADLQARVMPDWHGPAGEGGDVLPALDGPLSPLDLAAQLQRLASRRPLLELRAEPQEPPTVME